MTDNNHRSAPTSPGSNRNQSERKTGLFGTSGSGGGGGGGFLDNVTNQFSQSIANSFHDILNHNIFNENNLMDMGKLLYKSCNSCGNNFSIFLRKERKRCNLCMLQYCQFCIEYNGPLRVYQCKRCLVFRQCPLDKDALNTLRIRDLKWFLASRNVPMDTCNEKRELIELIVTIVNATNNAESVSHSSHGRNPHSRRSSASSTSASSSHASTSVAHNTLSSTASAAPTTSSAPLFTESTNDCKESNTTTTQTTSTTATASTSLNVSTFNLSDIKDESEIKSLSIRQLKLLLTRNFVDFKGCVERDELLTKATLLWQDKQQNNKLKDDILDDDDTALDANTCKICMENVIDCVLLECGHMLTCTDCGKILNECPVCRQFVVRVVHVFKG